MGNIGFNPSNNLKILLIVVPLLHLGSFSQAKLLGQDVTPYMYVLSFFKYSLFRKDQPSRTLMIFGIIE
jgi:hypothetical protein